MLDIGDRAPDFDLPDQSGTRRSLSGALAHGPVVVYFYPADFSPVCTAQACAIRDRHPTLDTHHVQVLGISPQGSGSHQRFATRFDLPFPLLADPRKTVIRAWGVDGLFGIGVRRATFLVEPGGTIQKRAVADFTVASHMDLLESVLDQNDEVR